MADTVIEVSIRFRPCREDDLPALEWMGLHASQREIIADTFAAQGRGEALMLLADAGGYPIGQAWIDFTERGSAKCPHLWAVRVFPPLQGAGLGRRLMAEAEALAARRGAKAVELGVEWDNPGARRFYEVLGYRPVGSKRETVRHIVGGQRFEEEIRQQILRKELATAPHQRLHGQATAGRRRQAG